MKLNYKVLWIDDQIEDYIDMGMKGEFEAYIESLGFNAEVICYENGNLAQQDIITNKHDLILSDYNIEGASEQGDVLIQKIRDEGVFTEVLFYSAQTDFDRIAKNLYRDRVSFFSLIGDESFRGFKDKAFKLINLTVLKLQELNNIRGLVMAETSELDNKVEDILLSFLSKDIELAGRLREYIIKIIKDSTDQNVQKASRLSDHDNHAIVKSRLFDADKKCRAINKMLELLEIADGDFCDFYSNYKTDVLDTRNDLAHAKSAVIDSVEYLIVTRRNEEEALKFTQENCVTIRNNLRKYSILLKGIREAILNK